MQGSATFSSSEEYCHEEFSLLQRRIRYASRQLSDCGENPVSQVDRQGEASLIHKHRKEIDARLDALAAQNLTPRLAEVVRTFDLSLLDRDIIVAALAAWYDPSFKHLYANFWPSIENSGLTASLLSLFLCDGGSPVEIHERLLPYMPLRFWTLVETQCNAEASKAEASNGEASNGGWRVNAHIARFLLGSRYLDEATSGILRTATLRDDFAPQIHLPSFCGRLEELAVTLRVREGMRQIINLIGSDRRALVESATWLCQRNGIPLLVLDVSSMCGGGERSASLIRRVARQAALFQSALAVVADSMVDEQTAEGEGTPQPGHKELLEELLGGSSLVFILSSDFLKSADLPDREQFLFERHPELSVQDRKQFWQHNLQLTALSLESDKLDRISDRYRFNASQIERAVRRVHDQQFYQSAPIYQHVREACQWLNDSGLEQLAVRIDYRFGWDDIILSSDQLAQLQDFCRQERVRHQVFDDWGFAEKVPYGHGRNLLFSGVSGTGKTMSASIIARELDAELYRIDLAAIVSKYIGETEKNLEKIFSAATQSNAILLFDEADAIFGKRGDVKQAHDRYANLEISYLLQRIENFDGITILTTNLKENIDEAFARRMGMTVYFPFPEVAERARIWRRIFPSKAPLNSAIDYGFLAETLKVTGGHIRNIALAAAHYAALDQEPISMKHILRGARREYQKLGKIFVDRDFEPYQA